MFDPNTLNDEQLKAATFIDKDVLLAAGPGSGKTHTMTSRILYLIEKCSADPSSILVITFTKDAACGMQKRFISASGLPYPVAFGTFHSVFFNMIKESDKSSPPIILYSKNKTEISTSVVKKFMSFNNVNDSKIAVQNFMEAVSVYKNTLDEEKAAVYLCRACADMNGFNNMQTVFPDMFRYYENIRKKSNLMDFDDMVYDCMIRLLYDNEFKKKWQDRFSHILIDEFQDINKSQFETVKILAGKKSRMFAVGDDDQSIYGFRGSDPSILKTYLEERNAILLHLNTNYRSSPQIVNASVKVISENKNRISKELKSNSKTETQSIDLKCFEDKTAQYGAIACNISSKEGSMAVLFRTNIEMQTFASYLTSVNIPYHMREKAPGLFDHFILKDIYAYLMTVYSEDKSKYLKEIINKPPRYIDYEYIIASKGDPDEIIKLISSGAQKGHARDKISRMRTLKKDLVFMKGLSVKSSIVYILKKVGYEKYAYSFCTGEDKKTEYGTIINEALRIFEDAENIDDITRIKEKYESALARSRKKKEKDLPELMTVHASKGLEFDTVIIPDINEGNFPHGRMPDPETAEEERRIFYVAMTRAKERLYLYYLSGKDNGKNVPSRFLLPLIKNDMHKKENGSAQ